MHSYLAMSLLELDELSNWYFFYSLNGSSGFIRGPGENPKPLGFSFHDKFKQGPLLSVVRSSCFFFSFSSDIS